MNLEGTTLSTLAKPWSRRELLRASSGMASLGLPFAARFGLGASSLLANAYAQEKRRPTPSQTEGPYYPVREPKDADFDLLKNGALSYTKGQAAWVEGTVLDTEGRPLKGASIEIWQCDEDGHYDHPSDGSKADPAFQGFGRVRLDESGGFVFRTLKPAPYTGRTPHIHAKIKLGKQELLTTQFYVQGEAGNAKDMIWRRLSAEDKSAVTSPFILGSDGFRASYSVIVRV